MSDLFSIEPNPTFTLPVPLPVPVPVLPGLHCSATRPRAATTRTNKASNKLKPKKTHC